MTSPVEGSCYFNYWSTSPPPPRNYFQTSFGWATDDPFSTLLGIAAFSMKSPFLVHPWGCLSGYIDSSNDFAYRSAMRTCTRYKPPSEVTDVLSPSHGRWFVAHKPPTSLYRLSGWHGMWPHKGIKIPWRNCKPHNFHNFHTPVKHTSKLMRTQILLRKWCVFCFVFHLLHQICQQG